MSSARCVWSGCDSDQLTYTPPDGRNLCQIHSELFHETPGPHPIPPIYSASCEAPEPGFLEQAVRDLVPESFRDVDARLAAMSGYSPIQDRIEAIDTRTARIEAAVDRIERALIRVEALLVEDEIRWGWA